MIIFFLVHLYVQYQVHVVSSYMIYVVFVLSYISIGLYYIKYHFKPDSTIYFYNAIIPISFNNNKKKDSHLMIVITQYMQYAISYFITSFTCWLVLCKYLEICWHRALKYTSNIFVGNSPTQQDHDAIAFM